MNVSLDPLETNREVTLTPIRVAIIYDEFLSGARAKHFAERLAAGLGTICPLSESMWRSELLECPPVADDAARKSAECDYLMISLCGNQVISGAMRQWFEALLMGAADRLTCVIALLGSDEGDARIVEDNRQFLRDVCVANGVQLFSHAGMPSPSGWGRGASRGNGAAAEVFPVRPGPPAPLDD